MNQHKSYYPVFTILFIAVLVQPVFSVGMDQINQMIRDIPGLEAAEQRALENAFDFELGGMLFNRSMDAGHLASLQRVVSAGIFEEVEPRTIASVARTVYEAELRGAPEAYVEDLALVGFVRPFTGEQLGAAARALEGFSETQIDAAIYQDLISYALANDWPAETITGVTQGLEQGFRRGVDPGKLALALIIRVDQGLNGRTVSTVVQEEITLLQDTRSTSEEKTRRDRAYQKMTEAVNQGVSSSIAQELYYEAVEGNWSSAVVDAVYDGMVEAHRIGLTPDKIALAMLIRVEQGLGRTAPKTMVQEEIVWVKEREKDRLAIIQNDKDIDYSKPVPDPNRNQALVEPQRRELDVKKPEPKIYYQSERSSLNAALMQQSINSFLRTPYKWGGGTRGGTDCSGFTQSVYREQGLVIPRVSRQQFQIGSAVNQPQLRYGDLIFFNKYGYGRISHVGIYVGNGKFAHASCSKGVTITPLNRRYYQVRWAGGKRVI